MIPDHRACLVKECYLCSHVLQLQVASALVCRRFTNLCGILFLISFDAVADSGFLQSLYRSNVTLNFDGIAEIVENGIITKTGVCGPSMTTSLSSHHFR
jgi:hypothetical protein